MLKKQPILLFQLIATVIVLGFVPGNTFKLAAMAGVWVFTFRSLSRREFMAMLGVNILFIGMNEGAAHHGVFSFTHPDFGGMPIYEYFMWGFYVLHTIRLLGGKAPKKRFSLAFGMAVFFAIPFATITGGWWLLLATAAILTVGFLFFHEKEDLAYAGYMVIVGILVEYMGVKTGQWSYPGHPWGGVPLWFITMWGGVGLFTRHLVLPLLSPPRTRRKNLKRRTVYSIDM